MFTFLWACGRIFLLFLFAAQIGFIARDSSQLFFLLWILSPELAYLASCFLLFLGEEARLLRIILIMYKGFQTIIGFSLVYILYLSNKLSQGYTLLQSQIFIISCIDFTIGLLSILEYHKAFSKLKNPSEPKMQEDALC